MEQIKLVVAVVIALAGSTGLWTFLQTMYMAKQAKKNNKSVELTNICKGVLAVLHKDLYELCDIIIEHGYKTPEQVENLAYMTKPYFALGGDGTLEKLLEIIDKYQIKKG